MPDPVDNASRKARWTREVRSRLSSLKLSPEREEEIVEELAQHLDDRCRELLAGGAAPDEAARLTVAEFRDRESLARWMLPRLRIRWPR